MSGTTRPLAAGALWCLVTGLLAPAAPAEEATLLRLALAEGASYRFAMTQTQEMTMNLGAMGKQASSGRNRMEIRQDVREVREDGSVVVDLVYERIVIEVDAAGSTMSFDSAVEPGPEAESDPMAGFARGMVGRTIQFVMSPRGEIMEVRGVQEMLDAVLERFAGEPGAEQVSAVLRQSFGEETIRAMLQQGSVVLPEQAVRAGDRWSQELVVPTTPMGRMVVQADYQAGGAAERHGRDCLEVAVAMTMTLEGESPMVRQLNQMFRQQGQEASIDWEIGETRGEGTLWIEKATGLTVGSAIDQTMAMTLDLTGGGEGQSLHMEMGLEQTIGVELLPD